MSFIDDVIDNQNITKSKFKKAHLKFQPEEVIKQAINLLTFQAKQNGIKIKLKPRKHSDYEIPELNGDRQRLQQVIITVLR